MKIAKEEPSTQKPKSNSLPENQMSSPCHNSGFTFCSDFSNMANDFEEIEDFTPDQSNSRILRTNLPIGGDQDNSILWTKNTELSPELNFTLISKFFNKSKGNLTIVYGSDWRCIIAESDFNTIKCESEYNKKEHPKYKRTLSSIGKPLIAPETETTVKGNITIGIDNFYNVNLTLEYYDESGEQNDADFNFKVRHFLSNPLENKKRLGVGIIDPEDEAIKIEFNKLEITGGL